MYKCLVVGLGNVGMTYDLNSNAITTHCKSLFSHKKFNLAGAVDIQKKKRILFEKKYFKPAYSNILKALEDIKPEIIVISCSTEQHLKTLKLIFKNYRPKIIICEKPMGINLRQALDIFYLCKKKKVKLFINYMRLSDPGVIKIKNKIKLGIIKKPIYGTVYYSRGLINNASHFFNILEFWFGNVKNLKILENSKRINKFDFETSFKVNFKNVTIFFFPCENSINIHNSIELNAKNGRLFYGWGGKYIQWQKIIKKNNIPQYNKYAVRLTTGRDQSQLHFVNNLFLALKNKKFNLCSGKQAIKTLKKIHLLHT